jgi:hypothetical protein
MATVAPEVEVIKTPANDLVSKFLQDNNIELYTEDLSRKVKMISDGSIIVEKPGILARYIK